jgi:hypothetical protein
VKETFNIYCDESCHLEHDNIPPIVLGAVWCPTKDCREIAINLRAIKQRHSLAKDFETKWVKVSPAKLDFYQDVLNYFFDVERLHFRAVVIPDKGKLRHDIFSQNQLTASNRTVRKVSGKKEKSLEMHKKAEAVLKDGFGCSFYTW